MRAAAESIARLKARDSRVAARAIKAGRRLPSEPGLYAWWVDAAGARTLGEGLGHQVAPGLIYAGQAGATRWPSGKTSPATLSSRISSGHLGHSIDGSTFRLTLAALLRVPLDLEMRSTKYLTSASEAKLTAWMLEHLSVTVYPVRSGDRLAALEDSVLAMLDPPLNLEGMPGTAVRSTLSRLRRELRDGGLAHGATRIGLVGCVKTKGPTPAVAADLYRSALFRGRRRAVERTCDRWFILSAKHGLIAPTRRIAPYDVTLVGASVMERRHWAKRVLQQIDAELGSLAGLTFEIHAGSVYTDWGLHEGLRARGAHVQRPAVGLGMGQQLAFYRVGAS